MHYIFDRDFRALLETSGIAVRYDERAIFLLTSSIHPTRFPASSCVSCHSFLLSFLFRSFHLVSRALLLLSSRRPRAVPLATTTSRSSSTSVSFSSFAFVWYVHVHPECQVSFSLRPCEKRETRENFRMVYGALPVLLLSHFSLPPLCMRESPPFRYISFKNFLRLSLRSPFLSLLGPTEVG